MKTKDNRRMAVPSYLGIPDEQKPVFQEVLIRAASKDFWHDFHHAKLAKILKRIEQTNKPTLGISTTEYNNRVFKLRKLILGLRQKNPGASLYDMFEAQKSSLYLVYPISTSEFIGAKSEEEIFNNISNLKFNEIRQTLIDNPGQPFIEFNKLLVLKERQPLQISIPPIVRGYNLSAAPVKVRSEYLSLAGTFSKLAENAENFILLIDASNLAISQLRSLAADPGKLYRFFIIQSVENEGDPATKIANFIAGQPNIQVYFLRDTGFRTSYVPFGEPGFTSNLFSGCTISATRDTVGTITADITSPTVNMRVENIGTASEPEEAGFLAFLKLLASNFTNSDEAMAHFLLKRAGDWCQALCLLDRGRRYKVEAVGESPPLEKSEYTLEELINFLKLVEIALLTHDKILLAYALALGLNVFFTMKVVIPGVPSDAGDEEETSNSIVWLNYFKNQLDSNPEAITAAAVLKTKSIEAEIVKLLPTFGIAAAISRETLTALDIQVGMLYTRIPQICIELIKATKGNMSQFILTSRVILESASQFDTTPKQPILELLLQLTTVPPEPHAHFELASRIETEIQQYVNIVEHFKTFNNLVENLKTYTVPVSFSQEKTNITNLITEIIEQKSIETIDHAPFLNFQMFIEKTVPSLQKDFGAFVKLFPGSEKELREAVKISEVSGSDKRKTQESYKKFYAKYQTIFNLQKGGDKPFEIQLIHPLQSNKIRTRKYNAHYDLNTFLEIFQTQYKTFAENGGFSFLTDPSTFISTQILPKASYLYNQLQSEGKLQEPSLTSFLILVFDNFVLKTEEDVKKGVQFEGESLNVLLSKAFQEEYAAFSIEQLDNVIDIGTSVTYEDGNSYTAVDICVIKKEQQHLWNLVFTNLGNLVFTNLGNLSYDNHFTPLFIYYRFLLFNLDVFTNEINKLDELYNDANADAKPYLAEDNEVYVKRVRTCLDHIKRFADTPISLEALAALSQITNNGMIDIDKFPPTPSYISKELILKLCSIFKAYVIVKYYEAQGALFKPPKRALSDPQLVRLFYLVLSSNEEFETIAGLLPDYNNYITIAKNFFYIFETGSREGIPDDMYRALLEQAKAYNDNLFGFLPGLAGGKRKRYRKTRFKSKRKVSMRKRRLTNTRRKATRKI